MTETSGGAEIRLNRVEKAFGENRVLKGVDLTITPGTFVALVGKSGCGKSTLLRLIAGLDRPTGGEIYIDEQVAGQLNPELRLLFQEPRLLPWRSVLQNVALGASGQSKQAAHDALETVGLGNRAGAWPEVLSGGQRQRVSLARALVGAPRILLLDEPLGALDALTRIQMQQLIESLWRDRGFTVVLVTHDVAEAVALADRVILMEEGRITYDEDIRLARPRARDSSFAYYEQAILRRVMGEMAPAEQEPAFAI